MSEATIDRTEILNLTSEIVSAHVGNNAVNRADLPEVIAAVHAKLAELAKPVVEPAPPVPAVPVRKSVTDDYIICLEDGRKLKTMKRHLMAAFGMTPDEYRAKWGLPYDYPMVAPAYSAKRQELAHQIGLGQKAKPAPRKRRAKRAA